MRIFTGSKNLNDDDHGGGAEGLSGSGLPFVPNRTIKGPSTAYKTVIADPGFLQGINQGQAAYQEKIAGAQGEADAQARLSQIKANIAGGYGPMAGIQDPNQEQAPPQMGRVGGLPVPIPAQDDQPDIFETKRQVGQAAKDAAYMQERQRLAAEHDARVKQAHADYDQKYQQAVAAQKGGGDWDDKTAEQKANARMGIWLSAVGSGLSGGDNKAIEYIKDQIKQDTASKAARAERMMKLAEMSKGALADAYKQRAEDLSNVDLNHAAMLKGITDQAETYARTMLPQEQQAQAQQKVAQLKVEAAKAWQDGHRDLNATLEINSGETTTQEALGKSSAGSVGHAAQHMQTMALYGDSMQSAIDTMKELPEPSEGDLRTIQDNQTKLGAATEEGKTMSGAAKVVAGRTIGLIPRNIADGVSPNAQLYVNAMNRANENYSRVLAGQGMTEQARQILEQQMALQPNDSKEVRAYKLAAMEREKNNFLSMSGQFGTQVGPGAAEVNIAENKANASDQRLLAAGQRARTGLPSRTPAAKTQAAPKVYAPEDLAALEWANKHPSDPRAKAIKAHHEEK